MDFADFQKNYEKQNKAIKETKTRNCKGQLAGKH